MVPLGAVANVETRTGAERIPRYNLFPTAAVIGASVPTVSSGDAIALVDQIADEVLINLGRNAGPNYLDQNRASVMLGWRLESTQFRVGYMNRFVPGSTGQNPTDEHAALFWVNHDIWLPRSRQPPTKNPPAAEGENP